MREANKAIQREKHLMPTVDELITDLNGSTVFSTLDFSSGYHQLDLDRGGSLHHDFQHACISVPIQEAHV